MTDLLPRPSTPRVAVIGDIGGQVGALRYELVRLGADPHTGVIPADLTIVQVGDVIHRGPDSEEVVALVDSYLHRQPDHWIQLIGNHEGLYLGQTAFEWSPRVDDPTIATLRRWWEDGSMVVAAAVPTADGDFLVTHAGLTAGFWRSVLDVPHTAAQAATALNSLIANRQAAIFRSGVMLTGRKSGAAGPLWASAPTELVPSWFHSTMPFSQIHGHSSITDWSTGELRGPAAVTTRTSLNLITRHETTTMRGGRIIGIDPDHGADPAPLWSAWEADLTGPVSM
ncbi:hypothetical protein HH308_27850 [Gordonia sp. TBRC 11910]|uniref:Calcineurin-like phosphoesterase domain-containing protein n=2 Tax=Gordonia asplenii TaxID=2725283 RepID=A0A848L1Z8_9ACTN|nr:hypothetical protein [Gordonia asplenii]